MHRRLAELVEFLDTTRATLLDAAGAVPPDRFTQRPGPDRWSAAELLEHLARVESSCARVVAKMTAEARANGVGAEQSESSVLGALDGRHVTDRTRRLEAPPIVAPEGGFSRDRALAALDGSRSQLRRAIADADGLALQQVHFAHRVLGDLDLYQWILFVGQHEQRHLPQLEEIARQVGTASTRARDE